MKAAFVVLAVLVPTLAQAQGTVYASSLENSPTGSFAVASDSWVAQEISWLGRIVNGVMLTPPCTLNSVELMMDAASGGPSEFSVSIYTRGSGGPGPLLGTLVGDSDPRAPGVYSYTATGITLSPATGYFVVVTSRTATADGAYSWSNAFGADRTRNDNLAIGSGYSDSTDGITWTPHVRQDVGLMAVYGTPVPEPASGVGLVYGAACLVYARQRWMRRARLGEAGIFPDRG